MNPMVYAVVLVLAMISCITAGPVQALDQWNAQNTLIQENLNNFIHQKGLPVNVDQIPGFLKNLGINAALDRNNLLPQLMTLARDKYSRGDVKASDLLFREALAQINLTGDKKQMADALLDIGGFFRQKGDNGQALEYLSRAVDATLLTNDEGRLQGLLNQMESLYIWQETRGTAPAGTLSTGKTVPAPVTKAPSPTTIPANQPGVIHPTITIGTQTISLPGFSLPGILSPGKGGISLPGLSAPQVPEGNEFTVPIPKIEFPGKVSPVKIPRGTSLPQAKMSVITIPREVPISASKASVVTVPGTVPLSGTASKDKAKIPSPGVKSTSPLVKSSKGRSVLTCAGPPSKGLSSYDDLYTLPEWARLYLKPVPGGRYAPYAGDTGMDIVAPRGIPFYAAKSGVVLYSAPSGHCIQRGPYDDQGAMRVRHPDGTETFYAHLSGRSGSLKAGSRIKQGEWMGNIGTANRVPHLHFTIYYNYRDYVASYQTPSMLLDPWPMLTYNI
jgi:hypothetical protein